MNCEETSRKIPVTINDSHSLIYWCVYLLFQIPAFTSAGAILSLILLFIAYIPANLLLAYVFSYAFEKFETCQAVLPNIFIFVSIIHYPRPIVLITHASNMEEDDIVVVKILYRIMFIYFILRRELKSLKTRFLLDLIYNSRFKQIESHIHHHSNIHTPSQT